MGLKNVAGAKIWGLYLKKQRIGATMQSPEGLEDSPFKLNLKVSSFYLEKQKSFVIRKIYFLSRTAKIDPKDGVSRFIFPKVLTQLLWTKEHGKTDNIISHFLIA